MSHGRVHRIGSRCNPLVVMRLHHNAIFACVGIDVRLQQISADDKDF